MKYFTIVTFMVISLFFIGCRSHYQATYGIQDIKKLFTSDKKTELMKKESSINNTIKKNQKKSLTSCEGIRENLEGYYFVDNPNCINKECGKVIFFTTTHGPMDNNYFVLDFDKKQYYYNRFKCGHEENTPIKEAIQIGSTGDSYYITQARENPDIFIFQHIFDSRFSNNRYIKAGRVSSEWAKKFLYNHWGGYDFKGNVDGRNGKFKDAYHSEVGLNTSSIIAVGKNSINKNFIIRYNLNSIIKKWVGDGVQEWQPEKGNENKAVNGKGKIVFYKGKNKQGTFSIKGTFKNGKLISNGILRLSYLYSRGDLVDILGYSSFEKNIRVTTPSKLSFIIDREFKKLRGKTKNKLNAIAKERAEERRKYSSSNNDLKNSCYANVENKISWCYAIKNEDMKNSCYANVENKISWCYAIKNEDIKNSCYANVENKISWCYAIKNEDIKNSCYANVENKISWCYAIKDEDMKNSCYANVENKISWCYSISK